MNCQVDANHGPVMGAPVLGQIAALDARNYLCRDCFTSWRARQDQIDAERRDGATE